MNNKSKSSKELQLVYTKAENTPTSIAFVDGMNDEEVYSFSSDDSDIIICDDVPSLSIEVVAGGYTSGNNDANCITDPKSLKRSIDNSVGLKKILFRNHLVEPLSFLLLLHDFGMELKLSKLIEDCGGLVYNSVNDIDSFTAVLVKDDSLHWAYSGPVFKVSYITACVQAKRIIDISPFFKGSVKTKFTENFDFMNVVYFKKYSWNSVPNEFVSLVKVYNKSTNESRIHDIDSNSDGDVSLEVDESRKKGEVNKKKTVNKCTRMIYSIEEEENIIKYIVKKKGFNKVRGNLFWIQMESKDICPCRTWQSMKEHFRKKIIFKLDCFKFLSDKEKKLFQTSIL